MKSIIAVGSTSIDKAKAKAIAWRALCFFSRLLWKTFCITCAIIKWFFLFAFGLGFLAVLHDKDSR